MFSRQRQIRNCQSRRPLPWLCHRLARPLTHRLLETCKQVRRSSAQRQVDVPVNVLHLGIQDSLPDSFTYLLDLRTWIGIDTLAGLTPFLSSPPSLAYIHFVFHSSLSLSPRLTTTSRLPSAGTPEEPPPMYTIKTTTTFTHRRRKPTLSGSGPLSCAQRIE